ncbi:MAG: hypothetical protein Q8M03_07000, partial [Legionella sp.]|nr:hypothetical protein [Legionella sp.]
RGYEGGGYVGPPVMPASGWTGGKGGGSGVEVHVHPPAGVETTEKRSRDGNGRERVDFYQMMKAAAVDAQASGDMDAGFRARNGVGRTLVNR